MGEFMLEYIGELRSYDIFITLGSILGSILLLSLYYKKNKSWRKTAGVFFISLAIVELGFFAGRLLRGLSYGELSNWTELLTSEQGTHFIGRVLFTVWIFPPVFQLIYRKKKWEWMEYLDLLCIFLTFQHIFNRIACLFNGCCTGSFYDGICALRYRVEGKTGPGYNYPVYPTQLFEIICMAALLLTLLALYRRGKRLFLVFCFGFAGTIFLSEFMMDKRGVILLAGLTVIQYAAILLAVTAAAMTLVRRKGGPFDNLQ